jgi:hypothetical protein
VWDPDGGSDGGDLWRSTTPTAGVEQLPFTTGVRLKGTRADGRSGELLGRRGDHRGLTMPIFRLVDVRFTVALQDTSLERTFPPPERRRQLHCVASLVVFVSLQMRNITAGARKGALSRLGDA